MEIFVMPLRGFARRRLMEGFVMSSPVRKFRPKRALAIPSSRRKAAAPTKHQHQRQQQQRHTPYPDQTHNNAPLLHSRRLQLLCD